MKQGVDKSVIFWLASGCLLVATMVVVGGITRLTHSGLSMVQWSLFMGSIPPLNEQDWMEVFNLYKKTPEFRLKNYDFTLEEFKSIFWWEYIHRMIGRLIGLVFAIPFFVFLAKKRLSKRLINRLLIACAMGAFQGFMGWYMVKSGLVKDPNVSHYRLAAHLITAFVLYCYLFWVILDEMFGGRESTSINVRPMYWLILLTFLQITYGAFVSGLKAGFVYNTFPKMGDKWVAESIGFAFKKDGAISLLENLASVQFIHRYLGIFVTIMVVWLWISYKKEIVNAVQAKSLNFLLTMVTIQVLLGIFTLILNVPIVLGVLHQIGALVLLTAQIMVVYHLSHKRE